MEIREESVETDAANSKLVVRAADPELTVVYAESQDEKRLASVNPVNSVVPAMCEY